jgi:hypothetical protein
MPKIKPVDSVVRACARRVMPSGSTNVPKNRGGKVHLASVEEEDCTIDPDCIISVSGNRDI